MIEQEYSYVLKQVSPTLQARGGFQYPSSGMVECPDWNPRAECGNGLHGWLRGEGDAGLASHGDSGKWLILSVPTKSIVDLVGKVKFPRAEVLKVGTRDECTSEMVRLCPGAAVIWGTATAGYRGTATAGDYGTATAGYYGTATAGEGGILRIRWHDGKRYRDAVGYVDEGGIDAGVKYRLNESGIFVQVDR